MVPRSKLRTKFRTKLRTKASLSLFVLAALYGGAATAEFRSIGEQATVFYDAPSTRGNKTFVVSRDLPVEIISTDGTWTKVRDSSGALAWVDRKALSDKRTVIVSAAVAVVRERADEQARVVFQAQQGVVLDFVDAAGGWAQVRHAGGSAGYVRIQQVWGL